MHRTATTPLTLGIVLTACSTAAAATVRFEIVPTGDTAATNVNVAPGGEVLYDLYLLVTPSDGSTPDNNGLNFFSLDVLTDTGATQQPLDAFDPTITQYFTIVASKGTPTDDDIKQIGGGQNTFVSGASQAGIANGANRQLIGQGRLLAPTTDGTYTVNIADTSKANVFPLGSVTGSTAATVTIGAGFTITVVSPPSLSPQEKGIVSGALFVGIGVILVLAAFLTLGPLAGLIMIVLVPLLMLAGILNT